MRTDFWGYAPGAPLLHKCAVGVKGICVRQAMHALCLADVALCVPAQDAAKHVRCLAPYLKVAPLAPGQRSPDKDRREAECLLCKLVRHTASPAWKSARLRQT